MQAGRDIKIKFGIGAVGIAIIVFAVIAGMNLVRSLPPPEIDIAVLNRLIAAEGGLPAEAVEALRERLGRTQKELAALRDQHPSWAKEIDAAVRAFNNSDRPGAKAAFARIDVLMDKRRHDLRKEQARAKHAQATLLYPFNYKQSEPLLCRAALLAANAAWYWIDCGRARERLGDNDSALEAFRQARIIANSAGDIRAIRFSELGISDIGLKIGNLVNVRAQYMKFYNYASDVYTELRTTNAKHDYSIALGKLGKVALFTGNYDAARTAHREKLQLRRELFL
jgi:tetratricopeptide (TPR) repeat protein